MGVGETGGEEPTVRARERFELPSELLHRFSLLLPEVAPQNVALVEKRYIRLRDRIVEIHSAPDRKALEHIPGDSELGNDAAGALELLVAWDVRSEEHTSELQ